MWVIYKFFFAQNKDQILDSFFSLNIGGSFFIIVIIIISLVLFKRLAFFSLLLFFCLKMCSFILFCSCSGNSSSIISNGGSLLGSLCSLFGKCFSISGGSSSSISSLFGLFSSGDCLGYLFCKSLILFDGSIKSSLSFGIT
jgi:hypothetical protein